MFIVVQIRYANESSAPSAGFIRVDAICYAGQRPAKMSFKFNKKTTRENSFQYKSSNFQQQIIRGFNHIYSEINSVFVGKKKCSTNPINHPIRDGNCLYDITHTSLSQMQNFLSTFLAKREKSMLTRYYAMGVSPKISNLQYLDRISWNHSQSNQIMIETNNFERNSGQESRTICCRSVTLQT